MKLKNLTAVITGSTGKIGTAVAIELAQAGMDCVCHYHTRQKTAAQLARQIGRAGQKAIAVQADLTDYGQIEDLMNRAFDFGTVRVLINSAAIFEKMPLAELTAETAGYTLSLNLVAPLMLSRALAGRLGKAKIHPAAKIVNITDTGGIRPWKNYPAYCASKAGLIAATKSLAKELAPAITVNAVAPGIIGRPAKNEKEQKQILTHIPAGRFGTPQEVAKAVLFVLENDYIAGQILTVDGGQYA